MESTYQPEPSPHEDALTAAPREFDTDVSTASKGWATAGLEPLVVAQTRSSKSLLPRHAPGGFALDVGEPLLHQRVERREERAQHRRWQ